MLEKYDRVAIQINDQIKRFVVVDILAMPKGEETVRDLLVYGLYLMVKVRTIINKQSDEKIQNIQILCIPCDAPRFYPYLKGEYRWRPEEFITIKWNNPPFENWDDFSEII